MTEKVLKSSAQALEQECCFHSGDVPANLLC